MKPFDLEKAKNGAAVCLRDGTPVKILDFEFKGPSCKLILYKFQFALDDDAETISFADEKGKNVALYLKEEECGYDLFMAPVFGYMNVYKSNEDDSIYGCKIFPSIEDCKKEEEEELPLKMFCIAKVELLDE